MNQPIYRQVIKDAWHLAWQNKFLWLFGFFAGLLINAGVYDLAIKMFSRVTTASIAWDSFINNITPPYAFVGKYEAISAPIDSLGLMSVWVVMMIIAFLAIGLFLIWLSIVSQGTLISLVARTHKKKKDIRRRALEIGLQKFWPILGINVLLKVTIALLVIFTSFPLVLLLSQSVGLNAVLYLLSFLIFVPLAIIIYFIAILASCYIILRDKPLGQSLYLAWELFKRNWLICLELGLLLFVIGFLVGLAVLLMFLVASIPVVLLLLAALALGSQVASLVVIVLAVIILVALLALSGAFVVTFQYASWVLLFERLTTRGGHSRLVRWIKGLESLHGKPKKKPKKRVVKKRKK